ncbi:hypothetical protein BKA65DRAFT_539567 [Rhexocercosporidium sp. MPI-PUGE-AT-0058]|nr:hypothetical protein BKA65DRAFT_539567 [Rhexocercosporidium sp. MPI-PUGE-AT-0058]
MMKLPQLTRRHFDMVKARHAVKIKSREQVTLEEWEELVMLFSRLSLGSSLEASAVRVDGAKFAFSAAGIDFTFNNISAAPSRQYLAARKPMSVLRNFNPKQHTGRNKSRGLIVHSSYIPLPFLNNLRIISDSDPNTTISTPASFYSKIDKLQTFMSKTSNSTVTVFEKLASKLSGNTDTTTKSTTVKPVIPKSFPMEPTTKKSAKSAEVPPEQTPKYNQLTSSVPMNRARGQSNPHSGAVARQVKIDPDFWILSSIVPTRSRRRHGRSNGKRSAESKIQSTESAKIMSSKSGLEVTIPKNTQGMKFKKLPACFSNIPIELRLMIWEAARPVARAVKLSFSQHNRTDTWPHRLYSGAVIPNVLHTCGESRRLALKWYTLSFGPWHSTDTLSKEDGWEDRIFMDWSRDYLYLQCNNCRGSGCESSEMDTCGLYLMSYTQRDLVQRLMYEFSGSKYILYRPFIWFPAVEDFRCIHWEKGLLFRHEERKDVFASCSSSTQHSARYSQGRRDSIQPEESYLKRRSRHIAWMNI